MGKFQVLSTRLILAVTLFLASANASGRAAANVATKTNLPKSDIRGACTAGACVYLPVIPYTPIPPVEIVAQNSGCTRDGRYEMRGEIKATMDIPVYNVRIEAQFYDWNNQLVGTAATTTVFTATLPGQLNPFEFSTEVSCQVEGLYGLMTITNWSLADFLTYAPLSADLSPKGKPGDLVYQVSVRIQNDGPVPLENVQAVVWSLQQADSITAQKIADSMAPGEAITVTREFYSIAVDITGVHAAAQGVVPAQP